MENDKINQKLMIHRTDRVYPLLLRALAFLRTMRTHITVGSQCFISPSGVPNIYMIKPTTDVTLQSWSSSATCWGLVILKTPIAQCTKQRGSLQSSIPPGQEQDHQIAVMPTLLNHLHATSPLILLGQFFSLELKNSPSPPPHHMARKQEVCK